MRRLIRILLIVLLLFGCAAAVFAAEEPAYHISEDDPVYDICLQGSGRSDGTLTIDTYLGTSRKKVLDWLEAHENDDYYLGTPYAHIDNSIGWNRTGVCRPNGRYKNNTPQMNCTGFIIDVMRYSGYRTGTKDAIDARMDDLVQWVENHTGYVFRSTPVNASYWNWFMVRNPEMQYYSFGSISEALQSGKLRKGDLIFLEPLRDGGYDDYGNEADCHIGFFWGESSSSDVFWHSGIPGKGSPMNQITFEGNQISKITPPSQVIQVLVFPLSSMGDLQLSVSSTNTAITKGNPMYTLSGVSYGIYATKADAASDQNRLETLTAAKTVHLDPGTYWYRQLQAGTGFKPDTSIGSVQVSDQKVSVIKRSLTPYTATPFSVTMKDQAGTTVTNSYGVFEVRYYAASKQSGSPVYTWYFRSKDGTAYFREPSGYYLSSWTDPVSGTVYTSSQKPGTSAGQLIYPIGTYQIRQIWAPYGYGKRSGYLNGAIQNGAFSWKEEPQAGYLQYDDEQKKTGLRILLNLEFADIDDSSAYYHTPVSWAARRGIAKGYAEDGTFRPKEACTRAQIVTFLWRLAGKPQTDLTDCPFTDVSEDSYYYKAVLWAYSKGITRGYAENQTFRPDAVCLREHAVTFLWRAAGKKTPEGLASFPDVPEDAYYAKAVAWASECAIAKGYSDGDLAGCFGPDQECLREHVVTFLCRFQKVQQANS